MRLDSIHINKKNLNQKSIDESCNDIAVIGMSIKAPDADDNEQFWKSLKNGLEMTGEIPQIRYERNQRYLKFMGISNKNIRYPISGYIKDIDAFDYDFFNITPREAELMDPNQRLFLQTAWGAIEDAGYGGRCLDGSNTGVYVGYGDDSDYLEIVRNAAPNDIDIAKTGNMRPVISSRLSYLLNLKGPNMILDTTCSSSLVAIHIAAEALKSGDCDMAIAGGIKLSVLPHKNDSSVGVESKTGRTKTFDENANGTLWSEGIGVIILKPLNKALADHDSIYGIIKGSYVNQDGKSAGITAPNEKAQEDLLASVWKESGINPEKLNYIEAHGTGTNLGDPIEIRGLTRAFERFTNKKQFCGIGSIKANLGHTVHAAGVIGIIKVLLMIKNNQIPPLINFEIPNRVINFEDSPLYITDRIQKLKKDENSSVVCGISSFGMSGTNAHVIVQEYQQHQAESKGQYNLLVLSAKTEKGLLEIIEKYIANHEELQKCRLEDICYTACMGRGHYNVRTAIVAKNFPELMENLKRIRSKHTIYHVNNITTGSTFDVKDINHEFSKENLRNIAELYNNGENIHWESLYKDGIYQRVHLPTYQFQKKYCWIEIANSIKSEPISNLELVGKNGEDYTDTEYQISAILEKITGYSNLNIHANFSEMGLDSISLTKFNTAIKSKYNLELGIADIFSNPTINKLGNFVDKATKIMNENHSETEMALGQSDDIAIIGISGKFPGANTLDEFWINLAQGTESISSLPSKRRENCTKYLKYINSDNANIQFASGGYMDGVDLFDPEFFKLSPHEAKLMDPHQRLFLKEAWKCIEDAGYSKNQLSGTNTGVFLGYTNDFRFNYFKMVNDMEYKSYKLALTPNLSSIIPSRISYLMDLKGPSLIIDTACSSSLVAIHHACGSIRNNECEMALAGGIRINLMPIYDEENNIGIESPTFRIRAFDEYADGTVWGEGAAAILLKPLDKAIADHDNIYAIIKGSRTNQDGQSLGITTPNPDAQTKLLKDCWDASKINPEIISYIDCHGTGTAMGDPMEISALNKAFSSYTHKKQFCGIGSSKNNIGHLDAASGIASVIKSVLMIKNKKIAPSINLNVASKQANIEKTALFINDNLREWECNGLRTCGVSSFGFSGTNCHAIIQEAPYISQLPPKAKNNIFVISNQRKEGLWITIEKYYQYVTTHPDINIENFCFTASTGRGHYLYRIGVVVDSLLTLRNFLKNLLMAGYEKYESVVLAQNTPSNETQGVKDIYSMTRNDAEAVLGYYLTGNDIPWEMIYQPNLFYKLSMPAYTFNEDSYWIDIPDRKENNKRNQVNKVNKDVVVELQGRENGIYSVLEKDLAAIWGEVLGLSTININSNFYEIGGHSIAMMQIITDINNKLHYQINISDFDKRNTIELLAEDLGNRESRDESHKYPQITHDEKRKYEPFPITDVQMSYLLGRNERFDMGGVCTHVYMEIVTHLNVEKLESSLNQVIQRHPMLRSIVDENGTQHLLEEVPYFSIKIREISDMPYEIQQEIIINEREKMSHQLFKPNVWPLISIKGLKLDSSTHHLYIGFDMLIADGSSLQIIGNDWIHYYENPDEKLPSLDITFRDYMIGLEDFKQSDLYEADKHYWLGRLEDFPAAPALVFKQDPAAIGKPHFSRLSKTFSKEEWNHIKNVAQEINVTPSSLLCTAYAEVLAYWSNQPNFAINLTVFNRYPFHQDVDRIIGDFTSVLLIEIDLSKSDDFVDRVRNIQKEILTALDHRHYDGVEFIRNIAAREGKIGEPVMPIVFTSMLSNNEDDPWSKIGETVMGLSQTPQVYLDHQAGEIGGELLINWDYVNDIFDLHTIESMFDQYINILKYLIQIDMGDKNED